MHYKRYKHILCTIRDINIYYALLERDIIFKVYIVKKNTLCNIIDQYKYLCIKGTYKYIPL